MRAIFATLVVLFGATAAVAGTPREIFQLYFSGQLLQQATPALSESRSHIDERLSSRVIEGIADTTGTSRIRLLACDDCLKLEALLDLKTRTTTTSVTHPREDIQVNIIATAVTDTEASKTLIARPGKFEMLPAQASSRTALTLHGVNARVRGSFGFVKQKEAERIALSAFSSAQAGKQDEISRRLETRIRQTIDEKAEPMLRSFNRDYRQIFYVPLFIEKRIPGDLHYQSSRDAFRISVRLADAGMIAPIPEPGADVAFREAFHEALFNAKAAHELGGKIYDEEDLAAYFTRQGLPVVTRRYGVPETQLAIRFCSERPIELRMEADSVDATLCAQSLRKDGRVYPGARLRARYVLSHPMDGYAWLRLSNTPQLVEEDPEGLPKALKDGFVEGIGALFPEAVKLGELDLPSLGGENPLVLSRAAIDAGWLTLEWK